MSDQQYFPSSAPTTAPNILSWLEELSNAVRDGDVDVGTLLSLLTELRQASAACADASDWILLAAREEGASLRQIAPAFGKGYVRAPAARLEKLHRQALDTTQWLEILRSRSAEDLRS